jgi:hypothetical protein
MDKELLLGIFLGCLILFGGGFAIGYHTASSDETVKAYAEDQAEKAGRYAAQNY